MAVEVAKRFGEREADLQHAGGRKAAPLQIGTEGVRDVEIRSPNTEIRRKAEARSFTLLRNSGGFGIRISKFFRYSDFGFRIFERVSQLHYVIEVALRLIAPD